MRAYGAAPIGAAQDRHWNWKTLTRVGWAYSSPTGSAVEIRSLTAGPSGSHSLNLKIILPDLVKPGEPKGHFIPLTDHSDRCFKDFWPNHNLVFRPLNDIWSPHLINVQHRDCPKNRHGPNLATPFGLIMGTVQGHEPENGGLVGQINSGLDTGTFGNCSGRFPKMG